MNVITLGEALQIMEAGEPFSIEWITADRQRKRGGEIISAEGARLYAGAKKTQGGSPSGKPSGSRASGSRRSAKAPNHYAHGTRNVYLGSGKIRKVHIQLITKLNGVPIV